MYNDQKIEIFNRPSQKGGQLTRSGDAQYDLAKMCTYTIMNYGTNEDIEFIVIQKGQYQKELEQQACVILLKILVDEMKLDINTLVIDRHTKL